MKTMMKPTADMPIHIIPHHLTLSSALIAKVNVEQPFRHYRERYALLNWAQQAFKDFRVVPPGMGICH